MSFVKLFIEFRASRQIEKNLNASEVKGVKMNKYIIQICAKSFYFTRLRSKKDFFFIVINNRTIWVFRLPQEFVNYRNPLK